MAENRMNREKRIEDFLKGSVWPGAVLIQHRAFHEALVRVLQQIPESAFHHVMEKIFVMVAVSQRAMAIHFQTQREIIIIFPEALSLSVPAIEGLLCHEIAHGFEESDQGANTLVRQWGFSQELFMLEGQ